MAVDRFIRFDKCPPKEEVRKILEDYFNISGTVSDREDGPWIDICVPGKPSFHFRRIEGEEGAARFHGESRWIEIFVGESFDIITRQQDEFTNNIAVGIARMLCRYYGGVAEFEEEE